MAAPSFDPAFLRLDRLLEAKSRKPAPDHGDAWREPACDSPESEEESDEDDEDEEESHRVQERLERRLQERLCLRAVDANAPWPRTTMQAEPKRTSRPAPGATVDARQRPPPPPPAVVDPFCEAEQARRLEAVLPRLRAAGGLHEHPAARPLSRSLGPGDRLLLGDESWLLMAELGRGAFARVFRARCAGRPGEPPLAAKLSSPANLWEWHVHRRLAAELPTPAQRWLATAQAAHTLGGGASGVLLTALVPGVTAQELVNLARRQGRQLDEALALLYAADLLRAVHALHAAGILHGDLKPDNVMVRCPDPAALDARAPLAGGGGWAAQGVVLIDFGRAVDTRAYAPGTAFRSADAVADGFASPETLAGRPWTFEIDSFAAAATAHFLLHAQFLHLAGGAGRRRPQAPLKRYWQAALWAPLFDALLNAPLEGGRPDLGAHAARLLGHFDAADDGARRRAHLKQALLQQFALLSQGISGEAGLLRRG